MLNTLLLFALLSAASAFHLLQQDEFLFKSWMAQHNKVYHMKEFYERLQIFTENKRRIDKHNEGNHSFTMGLNQFSDMTFGEFKESFLWSEPQNCSATKGNYLRSNAPHPDSIDWRTKGNYVTPVKNQVDKNDIKVASVIVFEGRPDRKVNDLLLLSHPKIVAGGCGSCWTFSTTGCLESVTAINSGKLVPLSEQQLVDCAQDFNNHGCDGGLPSQAFEYIMYNKGLMTEEDYPYTAYQDTCVYKPELAAAFVKTVVNITAYDEMGMVDAVASRNPVSFAFEVTSDFMQYSSGVYSSTECHQTTDKVNHAVLAVGYGEENGSPYWIVKNSWGSSWGINGYFLIERGKNMCGLAACSSFPEV